MKSTIGDGVFSPCISVGVFIDFKLWSTLPSIFHLQSSHSSWEGAGL